MVPRGGFEPPTLRFSVASIPYAYKSKSREAIERGWAELKHSEIDVYAAASGFEPAVDVHLRTQCPSRKMRWRQDGAIHHSLSWHRLRISRIAKITADLRATLSDFTTKGSSGFQQRASSRMFRSWIILKPSSIATSVVRH
jgi:hypothetical protein